MELDTTWYEKSPEVALDQLRDLRNQLKKSEMEVNNKGKEIQPYGRFKGFEYYSILELLYHWETRLGHYQEASDLCDEFLEPYLKKDQKVKLFIEDWLVKKARTIRALQGSLAAQEFLMPYVDHDKEENYLRDYFLELRDSDS
jgi:hypothetical protein